MNTPYETLLHKILTFGSRKPDRTGTGTISLFGEQMRFDLQKGFPLITTKRVPFGLVVSELLWILSGSTNIKVLQDQNNHIWDEWADENGDLGPVYGAQWRSWTDYSGFQIDQIATVIDGLRNNPHSRRHVVSAWNVADLHDMKLEPCHAMFQFWVDENRRLSCQLYQRSADMFLGVPFNIASYAALTHMIAQQTDLDVGEFVWTGGDCHIYLNHLEQVNTLLSRGVRPSPVLNLRKAASIDHYTPEHFELLCYEPHPAIPAPVAV